MLSSSHNYAGLDCLKMSNGDALRSSGDGDYSDNVLDIYPLNHYYFGSKDAFPFKEETLADRLSRMKLK